MSDRLTYQWTEGDQHLLLTASGSSFSADDISIIKKQLPANVLLDLLDVETVEDKAVKELENLYQNMRKQGYALAIASAHPALAELDIDVAPTTSEARDLLYFALAEMALGGLDEEE